MIGLFPRAPSSTTPASCMLAKLIHCNGGQQLGKEHQLFVSGRTGRTKAGCQRGATNNYNKMQKKPANNGKRTPSAIQGEESSFPKQTGNADKDSTCTCLGHEPVCWWWLASNTS